jgi:hypothetical protein
MKAACKIGVLTFHRCINYGSYWQARCLVEGLRASGHDAELLDHDRPDIRLREWRCAFQPQLPVRTPRSLYGHYAAKARRFLAACDRLPKSHRFALNRPDDAGEYNLILVGSDEVWNFRHPWYGGKPIFFGDGLNTGRLVSYAASFGNHDASYGIDPLWADKLRRFAAISVRDENSAQLIRVGLGEDPSIVLDPCLQFPPEAHEGEHGAAPYLALYGHGFPVWFQQAVRGYAIRRNLRIVSIGYQNDWAHEQRIEAGPEDFQELIRGASGVVTNFFHGTVFALVNAKPFVCTPSAYRHNKLRDLTYALGAQRHLVAEGADPGALAVLLDDPIASPITEAIGRMRERSSRYLETALG